MRRIFMLGACLLGLAIGAVAQSDTTPQAATSTTTAKAPARTPKQVATYYQTKLALTDDQRTKLVPVIAERQQKMEKLKTDTSRPMVKMRMMKAAMDDSDKKIKGVLTGDQWTKYQALEAEAKEKARERSVTKN